jgi:spore germination cell wall hydrolase CwlJ-like protein
MEKYPELNKETLEESFTKKELDMLYRVVQAEVGDYDFISKANVASVILNRHLFWEKSLYEVITEKNQFSTVTSNRYKKVVVDEETILACEYAWIAGDTTNGCVAFRSSYIPKKWYTYKNNYWELQFIDEAGHGFYK